MTTVFLFSQCVLEEHFIYGMQVVPHSCSLHPAPGMFFFFCVCSSLEVLLWELHFHFMCVWWPVLYTLSVISFGLFCLMTCQAWWVRRLLELLLFLECPECFLPLLWAVLQNEVTSCLTVVYFSKNTLWSPLGSFLNQYRRFVTFLSTLVRMCKHSMFV